MNLLCAALCAALCFASGFGFDLGPLNASVHIGTVNNKVDPTPDDIEASKNLNGLLELVRRFMKVGIDITVPPFEPFVHKSPFAIVFDDPESPLEGTVELSNLVASGAQKFALNKIEVEKQSSRVDFDITVPKVVADLDYSAINFKYNNFVFNASGHVQLVLKKLNMIGAAGFAIAGDENENDSFFVTSGVDLYCDTSKVEIDHDLPDIPYIIIFEVKDVLLDAIAHIGLTVLDDILKKNTAEQVIHFLYAP